jgi:poly-beta-hydroxybutyrate-responsive repressor
MCGSKSADHHSNERTCGCSERRGPRLLQPFMLLMLKEREGYGYELLEKVHAFGFRSMPPDPAAIYRNLRHMENEGWVKSTWDTKGNGPAKRIYRITPEGEEILHGWTITLRKRREALDQFMKLYESLYKGPNDLRVDEPLGRSDCDGRIRLDGG